MLSAISAMSDDELYNDYPVTPIAATVGLASSWAAVQDACKEKGLELVGFLWWDACGVRGDGAVRPLR